MTATQLGDRRVDAAVQIVQAGYAILGTDQPEESGGRQDHDHGGTQEPAKHGICSKERVSAYLANPLLVRSAFRAFQRAPMLPFLHPEHLVVCVLISLIGSEPVTISGSGRLHGPFGL